MKYYLAFEKWFEKKFGWFFNCEKYYSRKNKL